MKRIQCLLHIELLTGLHIQSGFGALGLHGSMVRNSAGAPIIPASSLKGRLRFQAIRFANLLRYHRHPFAEWDEQVFDYVFGGRYQSGNLFLDAAHLKQAHQQEMDIRATNQIDRETRTVSQSHLRFFETLSAQHTLQSSLLLRLPQDLHLELSSENQTVPMNLASHSFALVLGAIRLCSTLGGGKSRGLGHVRLETTAWNAGQDLSIEQAKVQNWFKRYLEAELPAAERAS